MSLENYTRNADKNSVPPQRVERESLGMMAEDVVIDFFNDNFPGQISVRPATAAEDSGLKHAPESKQIDAVVYSDKGEPIMCIQITTARDSAVRMKKMQQLIEKPFVRLDEMKANDKAIPKVLVYVDPSEVDSFLNDHDYLKHPKIAEQILQSATQCLKFVATKTKIKDEQVRISNLINILDIKKGRAQ